MNNKTIDIFSSYLRTAARRGRARLGFMDPPVLGILRCASKITIDAVVVSLTLAAIKDVVARVSEHHQTD